MRITIALAAAALTTLATMAGPVAAQEATQATAYINPDTGKPTANEDVRSDSSCESPVTGDVQEAGGDAATENVHVDGCLTDGAGAAVDTQVSYEVSGVGYVHACPDPDGDGPKTAVATDTDGDGENERCTLSGYETGNEEYHVRVFSDAGGLMSVTLCPDPEGDGCGNASTTSAVTVSWTESSNAAAIDDLPNTGGDERLTMLGLAAMVAAGGIVGRRRSWGTAA